jgi:hypothetical protein
MAADLPADADLGKYLAEHQVGATRWVMGRAPEPVTINGEAATRYTMSRAAGGREARREATAFRRGGRVFYFLVSFTPADAEHRDQARKAVASVTWSK